MEMKLGGRDQKMEVNTTIKMVYMGETINQEL